MEGRVFPVSESLRRIRQISLIYHVGAGRHPARYLIEDGLPETTFEACDTGDTFFNGGFIVASAGCYPVSVSVAGGENWGTVLRIGVDACPTSVSDDPEPLESGVCSFETVWSTVQSFLAGYNSGETNLTARFIVEPDRFQWYSEPPDRLDSAAFDRSTLDSYLATRHEDGHHLEVSEFRFNGYRPIDRTGHFGFVVLQDAKVQVDGKGAVDCVSGKIMVWSLGPDPGPTGS